MSRVLAASLVVAAAATFLAPGEIVGFLAAAGVTAAVLAVWSTGSAGPGNPTRKVGTHLDRATSAGLRRFAGRRVSAGGGYCRRPLALRSAAVTLGTAARSVADTAGADELGFAAAFEPPDPAGLERLERLERLRPGARE